jgi:hypothetical protein
MTIKYTSAIRNAMLDTITSAAGGSALLRIYDNTAPGRPANANTAVTTQVKLAELTCNATFAAAASGGVLTLNAITGANALASGTASWFRITNSAGTVVILDGDISTTLSDLNLSTTTIVSGQPISITSFTITEGNG